MIFIVKTQGAFVTRAIWIVHAENALAKQEKIS